MTVEQLASNAGAATLRLPADVLDELTTLAEAPTDYWGARSRRTWA